MVSAQLMSGNLDNSFNDLMVSGGGENGQAQNGSTGTTLSGWKDLPMELLLRIVAVAGDNRMVIVASGVCTRWRDALGWGVTNLSFSSCQDHMNDLVISLAHKLTKLQVLSLRQIKPQLEDSAVEAVANYCHDLRKLDLSRSFRLSDRSLYALANGCPRPSRRCATPSRRSTPARRGTPSSSAAASASPPSTAPAPSTRTAPGEPSCPTMLTEIIW